MKIKYFQTIEQLLHPSTVTIALNGKREIALFCYNKKPHFKVTQTGILQIISCKTENLQRGLYCATTDADYEHNLLCMIYTETESLESLSEISPYHIAYNLLQVFIVWVR